MAQMRRVHLVVGILGVVAFLFTGQIMRHHHPAVKTLDPEARLMYISRHIYLLGAALVNVVLGLYVRARPFAWKQTLQWLGSALILLSPILLLIAFFAEQQFGIAGRSWRSHLGLFALFVGAMVHLIAGVGYREAPEPH